MIKAKLDFEKHCKLPFGAYTKAHGNPIHTNLTNSMRIHQCMCLELTSSGDFQGNYKFLNLNTGSVVKRKQFKDMSASDGIIQQVKALACHNCMTCAMLLTNPNGYAFGNDLQAGYTTAPDDGAIGVDEVYKIIIRHLFSILSFDKFDEIDGIDF